MQSIILKNFKSYENQTIASLNSRINIVVGANGQGKSNFFKAISFLFTDRFTINRAQFNATLYRGSKTENPQFLVQANFSQKQDGQKEAYKVTKSWSNYTIEDLKINNKSVNLKSYENFIQSFGLSYTNPYNIVQQGKISQIAQMTQNQLYLLLEQTAGVKRFLKKHEEAQLTLNKIETDLVQSEESLKFLKDKMSQVQEKKYEYEFYSVQEKVRKIKKKRELGNYLKAIQNVLDKVKSSHLQALKQYEEAKIKEKDVKYQIEEKQRSLKVLFEKTLFYQKEHSEEVEGGAVLSKNEMKSSLTKKKKQLKDLQKNMTSQQKMLKQSQQKLAGLQKQLNIYREKYETIKLDFQVQGESKDSKKLKEAYQLKITTQKQTIKSLEQEVKKVTKMQSEFKTLPYAKQESESLKLKSQLSIHFQEMKKNRLHQIQLGRNKMNLECEFHTLSSRKKNLDELIKKLLPIMDFRLLAWLKQNKIQGVYGYMIEHLKIDHNVSFAYELVGLNKLCTLLVENDNVAAQVVEINKKIKGKNVNILPLSYVKAQINQKRSYPKIENVFSLLNQEWISCIDSPIITPQVKSNIQKVINNTFAKYVLVQDYSTALKVSKQYNLNCITADRQIVFADAYMCKVGREEVYEKGKIQIFDAYQKLSHQITVCRTSMNSIEKRQVELQNMEIQLINKKQKLQLRSNQLDKIIDQGKKIESIIKKLELKKKAVNYSIQNSNHSIQQYEKALQNIKNNIKTKFKEQDFKKAESDYFSHKQRVQALFTANYQHEKNLSTLAKDMQILTKQITNLQGKGPQSIQLQSKHQILKNIEKEKNRFQIQISQLNSELTKIMQKVIGLKQKEASFLAEITVEQENFKDILSKSQALSEINEQEQDQVQELSHSLSRKLNVNSMNAKKRQFYTARDKVFFNKITNYLEKVTFYTDSTKEIRRQKERLLKYIQQTQTQAKQYMKSFVSNFEKHFIRYFLRIVPNGKADIRTKIYTQKVKGITKNGHSLEIKVTFNEEEGIRRWSEFSGGQKTILALCIILAIQKCEPSPFCVLDQVDAALDPFYASKLVDIIVQESQYCQYFITSFKKSMLDFPQNITNYYLVKNVNRISNITHVQKNQAQDFIESIAE